MISSEEMMSILNRGMTVRHLLEATGFYDPSVDHDTMIRNALIELRKAQLAMNDIEEVQGYAYVGSLAGRIQYSHQSPYLNDEPGLEESP